jgi:hypothetical protein
MTAYTAARSFDDPARQRHFSSERRRACLAKAQRIAIECSQPAWSDHRPPVRPPRADPFRIANIVAAD